jgi:hypothetical protein
MDRVYLHFGIPYENAVRVMQWAWVILPVVTGYAALRICRNLRASELRPLRGVTARMVGRTEDGGLVAGKPLLANPSWTPEAVPIDADGPRSPVGRAATLVQAAGERAEPGLRRAETLARRTAVGLAVLVAGAVLGAAAAAAAAVAIAAGLAAVLPTWAAVLIAAGLVLVLAAGLVVLARRRRAARPPA